MTPQLPLSEGAPPLLEVSGAVATVTLRRPGTANRIEVADIDVLNAHCKAISDDKTVRCVILTGTGKHFSAGYDIGSVLQTLDRARRGNESGNAFASMVDAVEGLPQVTVCALNGGVFGGSTDLALACDFRLGVASARMVMPAARLGLHYYESGLRRYVSRLGLNAAKRLFLLAQEFSAQEMLSIGFLDAIVDPAALLDEAWAIGTAVAATAPLASSGMKAALNAIAAGHWNAADVARAELECLQSDDLREGVAAWSEKRAPAFRGQ